MNRELPDVQVGFRKGRGIRDQIANIRCIIEKAREFQKNICIKEMGIPDHLRNLYAGQEATVRTRHGTTDWFQIGKGVRQGCILLPCLFNLYAVYITRNVCSMKHKVASRLLGEISITSDMQMTPPLWQKVMRN